MRSAPPKVFISATSADLGHVRLIVRDALLATGCLPVTQDHFPPDYREVDAMLRDKIADCDAMIHVAGLRYGSEPSPSSQPAGSTRKSYTQLELELARQAGLKKIFTFVCPENFPFQTTDSQGKPLSTEPAELADLQNQHRARLLASPKVYHEVHDPSDVGKRVRELQIELEHLKGQVKSNTRSLVLAGSAIALALVFVIAGTATLLKQGSSFKSRQEELQRQIEVVQQTQRVLDAYQLRFRELRDRYKLAGERPDPKAIDAEVRTWLAQSMEIDANAVTQILETEAPKLAKDYGTSIDLKLKALFAMGEYGTALEQGQNAVIDPTISSLQTLGDAAMVLFETAPAPGLLDDAIRYYRGAHALVDREQEPRLAADLTISLASALDDAGKAAEAEALLTAVIPELEKHHGHNHLQTLAGYNNLARIFQFKGDYAKAEQTFLIALDRLGSRPDALIVRANLAALLQDMGEDDRAETLHRENYAAQVELLGPDHRHTLTTRNNIATLIRERDGHAAARPLLETVLADRRRALGDDHPDTLRSMNNLAGVLDPVEEREQAESLMRHALVKRSQLLGEDHPDTLESLNSLSDLHYENDEHETAAEILNEIIAAKMRVFGPSHLSTLQSKSNLAVVLEAGGDLKAAGTLFQSVSDAYRQRFAQRHYLTIDQNLRHARFLRRTGNLTKATALVEIALSTAATNLKPGNASTREAYDMMNYLAVDHLNNGDLNDAERLLVSALEVIRDDTEGDQDYLLTAMNNLAAVRLRKKDFESAEQALSEVYDGRIKHDGADHEFTLRALNNLGMAQYEAGKLRTAEATLRKAYEGLRSLLGESNEHTIRTKTNLDACLKDLADSTAPVQPNN